MNISTLEINLSQIEREFNWENLRNVIVHETENKTWIYNVKEEEIRKELKKQHEENELKRERKRLNRKEIEEKLRKQNEEAQKEKIKLEKFYEKYKRPIIIRRNQKARTGRVWHIDNCPLKKAEYMGVYYANYNLHCKNCDHFRGKRDNNSTIVCLAEYYMSKSTESEGNSR